MKSFPPRVHILLAREAPYGVAIRRGPSDAVCTVGWNRTNDTFVVGQWIKGRIYERRSDLSPDGRFLIYFAMNGKWQSEVRGSWTAVSRAPYLKAVGLWSKGDCWNGGGLFTATKKYWINGGRCHQGVQSPAGLKQDEAYPGAGQYGGECPGVYYLRLQRDGWTYVGPQPGGDRLNAIFEKRIDDQWLLRKRAYATIEHPEGKGCYYDQHELLNVTTQRVIACPEWEWAELDRSRLVWVAKGKLYTAPLTPIGLGSIRELFDFGSLSFQAIEAPY